MIQTSNLIRLATVGLAVAALGACTPRPAGQTGAGNDNSANPGGVVGGPGNGGIDGGGMGANMPGSEQDFVVNVGDRIYFDLDSYQVRSEAFPRLDAQVAWLRRYPSVTVRIEGNADERGTREYNLALGARRAESVRTYLVERGIAPARIDTISYGKERPIAQGSGEETFARNRNAHTAIVSGAAR